MKRKLALLLSVILLVTSIVPMFIFEASAANAAPSVLPALRSWTGGTGSFTPNASTVLVYNGTEASEQIKLVQEFFTDMLGITPAIKTSGTSNAIIFKIDANAGNKNSEGYTLNATTSSITISAPTKIGLLYGGITVVQGVYGSSSKSFPVGSTVDYPDYKSRGGMIDIARLYMPIDELKEVSKYMAWYKLNEIHVHLNDNGKNEYSAFRLECETYPELTAKDGHYTKEEYKQYQKDMLAYGVTVISEIDSPFHAECFRNIEGVKFLEKATLDLSDANTVQIMKNIWTEYISGTDPVFIKKSGGESIVHIGMDEYPTARKAEIIAYCQVLINHVNSYGYTARFWSGAGSTGCLNGGKFTGKYQVNYWDFHQSGIEDTPAMGCPVINNFSAHLYISVGSRPTGIDGFENKFTKDTVKTIWERKWQANVGRYNGQELLPAGDEKLLGAHFAIWNDWGSAWFGLTYRDVIDRVSLLACMIAEKNWSSNTSFDTFWSNYEKQGLRAGSADPFNVKAYDKGDIKVDFSTTFPKTYTAASVVNGEYVLNGTNPISLGNGAAGFPNTLSFDLLLDELPAQRTAIFSGYDTEGVDIYIDPDGTIGVKSMINEDSTEKKAAYFFTFDYKLTAGVKTNIKFTSTDVSMALIINNAMGFLPNNSRQSEAYFGNQSDPINSVPTDTAFSTLTIPLGKVGAGLKGKIDNINITDSACEIPAGANIALNKTYTTYNLVDGVVTDENKISRDYGAKLTDGVAASTTTVTDWFGFFDNDGVPDIENCESGVGYVLIDLGASYDITKIKVHVRADNAPASVAAYVSNEKNGTYTKAATLSGTASGNAYWLSANTSGVSGQYVKIEVEVADYWALFNEIEVYGAPASASSIKHDALNAPVSASRGFTGTTSWSGMVAAAPSILTDGYIGTSHSPTSGEWYIFQTKMNTEEVNGGWGNVGKLEIDLGEETEIEKIDLHLANSTNLTGIHSSITEIVTPSKIEVFAYVDGAWQSLGTAAIKADKDIIYWSDVVPAETVKASKIRVDVTLNAATDAVVWGGLMDEVAVYAAESTVPPVEPDVPVKETVDHIAVGKPTTVSGDFTGRETGAKIQIGAPAILTDGAAYSLHDSVSGNWMLYQTWLNSVAGELKWGTEFVATIDLEGEYVIDSVKVHLANSQNFEGTTFTGTFEAPKSVEAFALVDGEWKSLGQFAVNTTDATYWTEVVLDEDMVVVATQIKIVTILDAATNATVWGGLMDEIAVYGEEYVAPPTTVDRLLGDVNGDGEVDKKDYAVLKRFCFDTIELSESDLLASDVNQDGEVDKKDYAVLKRACFDTYVIAPEYIQVPVEAE